MQITDIVFFNHWHYGDLFSTRGLVTDIQSQLPGLNYQYIHSKNARSTQDLASSPDADTCQRMLAQIPMHQRLAHTDNTLFINTWVGAYQGLWPNTHPSYMDHRKIYAELYRHLSENYQLNLKLSDDWHYVPDYDIQKIDSTSIQRFFAEHTGKTYLFCNGQVQSTQSSMGNMAAIIDRLAGKYPADNFIATERFPTQCDNIYFTDDIFHLSCDICEIGLLSHSCDLIVGKNSGPFTYSTTRENLNSDKKFICFSHKPEDVLPYGLDFTSEFLFSNNTDDDRAVNIISECAERTQVKSGFIIK
jgi:hypothetical protein